MELTNIGLNGTGKKEGRMQLTQIHKFESDKKLGRGSGQEGKNCRRQSCVNSGHLIEITGTYYFYGSSTYEIFFRISFLYKAA